MSLNASDLPKRQSLSGTADANGDCLIRFKVPGQTPWSIEQITIEMLDAPFGAVASLRVNGSLVTPLVPNGDAAAGDPPLPVYPGDLVEIAWEGVTVGAQGKALLIYRTASYR